MSSSHSAPTTASPSAPHRPDWVPDAVFYQIFPDRWARAGGPDPDLQPWGAPPDRDRFQGGDLIGITEHLDHLADLGVTALYLTPVFAAGTNHRYDTEDYFRIDPMLGDDANFDKLVGQAHERDIRIVLDAVFHHCGYGHPAFQDVLRRGPESPYANWFFVDSYPVSADPEPTYRTCSGCWYLPKLNVDHPALRAHLFDAVRHWTTRGIDGWRLDVPYMMENPGFWAEFRQVVREINPDAYIVAEVWEPAGEWTTGRTSDAAMNYQLRDALLDFLVDRRTGAGTLAARTAEIDREVGADAAGHMLNLLDSHDTARLRTVCGGEPELTRLSLATLFALRGAPMVYYGDEVGMAGLNDPECRGAMQWDRARWDTTTLDQVTALIRLRRGSVALRRGDQLVTAVTDDVVRIDRHHPDQQVAVLVNRANHPAHVAIDPAGVDLATGAAVPAGSVAVPARGAVFVDTTRR
ncbi:glycoside hydrolase family 13 protein [Nakamurella endophytica]|uniref:Neopullulanase n=1 Tax=Nakamurella endophytica TaxID=1748367 RepID=A0A917SW19_9ACTN|nr:glycoside hydrolase family 13 protein [Nakamurella endophytica]GGL98858.1 neopullulanase [Nakamurella endophytica]